MKQLWELIIVLIPFVVSKVYMVLKNTIYKYKWDLQFCIIKQL